MQNLWALHPFSEIVWSHEKYMKEQGDLLYRVSTWNMPQTFPCFIAVKQQFTISSLLSKGEYKME